MRIWPFRRLEVSLTDGALDRAIRAGVQFPLEWFLTQTPEVQETIAHHRDKWLEDLILAAGYANLDPEKVQLAIAAEDGDTNAAQTLEGLNAHDLALELARRAAQVVDDVPQADNGLSMSGLGERRLAAAAEREAGSRKGDLSAFGGRKVGT